MGMHIKRSLAVSLIVALVAIYGIAGWRSTLTQNQQHHVADQPTITERTKEHRHVSPPSSGTDDRIPVYTFWLTVFTGLMALGQIGLIGFSFWQGRQIKRAERLTIRALRLARNQARSATRAADATLAGQRPWLKIELEIAGDLMDDGYGVRCEFKGRIKNIGSTPATNLQVWASMAVGGIAYADAFAKIPPADERFGNSLFPNESREQPLFGRLTYDEIAAASPFGQPASDHKTQILGVAAIGSVSYRFAGGEGRTTKAYDLAGPGSGGILRAVNLSRLPVTKDRLALDEVSVHDTAT